MSYSHHHHGNIVLGRITVAVAIVFVLAADWLICRQENRTPFPVAGIQITIIISVIWLVAGAIAVGMRYAWGRAMVLTILYSGAFGFFVTAIITVGDADGRLAVRLIPLLATTSIYLVFGLILTHSKHVKRLTSRAWE